MEREARGNITEGTKTTRRSWKQAQVRDWTKGENNSRAVRAAGHTFIRQTSKMMEPDKLMEIFNPANSYISQRQKLRNFRGFVLFIRKFQQVTTFRPIFESLNKRPMRLFWAQDYRLAICLFTWKLHKIPVDKTIWPMIRMEISRDGPKPLQNM